MSKKSRKKTPIFFRLSPALGVTPLKGSGPVRTRKKKGAFFFLVAEFSMMNTWRKVFKFSGIFYQVLIRSNPGSFVHISILRVPPTATFLVAPEFLVKNQNRSKK